MLKSNKKKVVFIVITGVLILSFIAFFIFFKAPQKNKVFNKNEILDIFRNNIESFNKAKDWSLSEQILKYVYEDVEHSKSITITPYVITESDLEVIGTEFFNTGCQAIKISFLANDSVNIPYQVEFKFPNEGGYYRPYLLYNDKEIYKYCEGGEYLGDGWHFDILSAD